ncbi:MAG: SCO family protein [Gemmatimonadales bacterium]|nr:MAG: SCO family protein [Gemmatimonadales bacterium]
MARRILQVVTGVLLGLAVVAVIVLGFPGTSPPPQGMVINTDGSFQPYPAPPLALETTEGEAFTNEDLQGEITVVFFGFANCPDVCPITLWNLTQAAEALEEEGLGFRTLFVTVDPARDTPDVLRAYMNRYHPSMLALRAEEEVVHRTARDWGVHVAFVDPSLDPHAHHAPGDHGHGDHDHGDHDHHEHDHPDHGNLQQAPEEAPPLDPGDLPFPEVVTPYAVDHSARSLVVDRRGRIVETLAPYLPPAEIVEVLRPLIEHR